MGPDVTSTDGRIEPGEPLDVGVDELSLRHTQTRAVRGWLWTLVYVGALTPLTFLANAVLARTLGVTGYGRYSYLFTVLSLGQALLALGYGTAVGRYAAAHHGAGRRPELLSLLRSHNTVNVAWAGSTVAVLLLVLLRPSPAFALALVLASYASAFLESSSLAIPALQRSDRHAQISLLGTLGVQLTVIVLCLTTRDVTTVLVGRLVVGAALAPLRLVVLPRDVRRACLSFGPPRLPREVLRFGAVAYASGLLSLLVYSRTEVVLLNAFDQATAIGLFALAFGLSGQVTSLVDAAAGPLTPAMTSAVSHDASSVGRLVLRAEKAVTMTVLAWAAATIMPAALLIPVIYGDDFRRSAGVFLVAAFASFFQSLTAPLESYAYATRQPGLTLRAHGLGFLVGTALSLALIPSVGLYGAAAGNAAGQITSSLVLVLTATRQAGLRSVMGRLLGRGATVLLLLVCVAFWTLGTPLVVGLAVWPLTLAGTVVALKKGVVVKWDVDELSSLRNSLPPRLAPLLDRLLPSGTAKR